MRHLVQSITKTCLFACLTGVIPTGMIAFADVATSCVSVDQPDQTSGWVGQRMTNTCSGSIRVHWCHVVGTKPDETCGEGKNYFVWSSKIEAGESKANRFMLPADTPIDYKACWGSSYANDNGDGTLSCSAPSIDGLATEGSVMCGRTLVNYLVESKKPGIFILRSNEEKSRYVFNTIEDGEPRPMDVGRAVRAVCGKDFEESAAGSSTVSLLQGKFYQTIKKHADKLELECNSAFSAKSCVDYVRNHHIGLRD